MDNNQGTNPQLVNNQPQAPSQQPQPPQYPPVQPPQVPQQPKPSSNLPLMVIALAVLLLAVAAMIYVLSLSKNNKQAQINKAVAPTTAAQITVLPTNAVANNNATGSPKLTGSITDAVTVPVVSEASSAGYVKKTTLCYTTLVPQDAKTDASNNCAKYITNGVDSKYIYTEHIAPIFTSSKYNSLGDLVDKRIIDSTYKLVKDENITLDGVPARKLTEENSKLKLSMVRVFVYLPNKYKSSGIDLAGFEVSTTLDSNDSLAEQAHDKKIFETLLSNWKWK